MVGPVVVLDSHILTLLILALPPLLPTLASPPWPHFVPRSHHPSNYYIQLVRRRGGSKEREEENPTFRHNGKQTWSSIFFLYWCHFQPVPLQLDWLAKKNESYNLFIIPLSSYNLFRPASGSIILHPGVRGREQCKICDRQRAPSQSPSPHKEITQEKREQSGCNWKYEFSVSKANVFEFMTRLMLCSSRGFFFHRVRVSQQCSHSTLNTCIYNSYSNSSNSDGPIFNITTLVLTGK